MLTNKQKDKIDEKKASLAPALKCSEDVDYTEGGQRTMEKRSHPTTLGWSRCRTHRQYPLLPLNLHKGERHLCVKI